MHRATELRIILLGRSGDGKSSAINTILGEKSSQVGSSTDCHVKAKTFQGKTIRLVETPGLFDSSITKAEFQQEVVKCTARCAPGPHTFIITLKVGRYTAQEARILEEIEELFGEEVLKYSTVLFTNGDQLDDDQTIEEFVQQSTALRELVEKCGGRVHVIDNKYWKQQQDGYRSNRVQVEKLLYTIEEMVEKNEGRYYSSEKLQAVKKRKGPGKLIRLCEIFRLWMKKNQGTVRAAVVLATLVVVGVFYYR